MGCSPAPGLLAEAVRCKAIGVPILGIVGDQNHTYGFHVCDPPDDYSEFGMLNVATSPPFACAIDIPTDERWPGGREYVDEQFMRCRLGTQPPDCAEMIGSWDGRTAWYWSWRKGRTVELYRGRGHLDWLHQSKFRSLARRDGMWLAGWGRDGKIEPASLVERFRARLAAAHAADPTRPATYGIHLQTRDATRVPAHQLLAWYGDVNPVSGRISVRYGHGADGGNPLVGYLEAVTMTMTEPHDAYFGRGLQSIVKGLQARAKIPVHGEVDALTLVEAFGQPARWGG